eukprot:1058650-Prymnesium_polylepis.1
MCLSDYLVAQSEIADRSPCTALPARPPAPRSAAAAVARVATQFRGRRTHAERVLRSGRTVKGVRGQWLQS